MAQAQSIGNMDGEQKQQQKQQLLNMSVGSGLSEGLLHRVVSGNPFSLELREETEEEGDVELSLGLSLNGRFGVDPRANKLTRSSSIPDFVNPTRENGGAFVGPVTSTNLMRTCSLPADSEEQWRKRKEVQMQRRMEVKKKRLDKKSNLKPVKDMNKDYGEENGDDISNYNKKQFKNLNYDYGYAGVEALVPHREELAAPQSQGSIRSQGSGLSGIFDSESQRAQSMHKCMDAKSRSSVRSSTTECEQKSMVAPRVSAQEESGSPAGVTTDSNRCDKSRVAEDRRSKEEMVRNVLEDMPCVSTKGNGPNGRRIEGFLYRYRKGEEVRIVCVCHGSFLSPAEFVKHAGGGDVAQPLKHIVVNPSPLL